LQVKDQGKNEAGELYCKLEKVCYFSVQGFASWVFHIMHRNQECLWQVNGMHSLASLPILFYIFIF